MTLEEQREQELNRYNIFCGRDPDYRVLLWSMDGPKDVTYGMAVNCHAWKRWKETEAAQRSQEPS